MAIKYENFASDTLMSFGKSFSRLNGQPLDKSSIWYDYNDAKAYAATGAAYIGQQLAVINTVGEGDEATTTVNCYVIKDEAGNLTQLSASEIGEELASAIANLDDKVDNLSTVDKYISDSETIKITHPADGNSTGSIDVILSNMDQNLIKIGTISTNGSNPEITEGGLFVDPQDIADIANAKIEDAIENSLSINNSKTDGTINLEIGLANKSNVAQDEENLLEIFDNTQETGALQYATPGLNLSKSKIIDIVDAKVSNSNTLKFSENALGSNIPFEVQLGANGNETNLLDIITSSDTENGISPGLYLGSEVISDIVHAGINGAKLATKDELASKADLSTVETLSQTVGDLSQTVNTKIPNTYATKEELTQETNRATGIESGLRADIDTIKNDYLKSSDKTELQNNINTVDLLVDTLIDTDTGKTIREIANDELAKQLIPEEAKESLDTLAEIAAWIQDHPDDAAAMNKAIEDLEKFVGTLPEGITSTTIIGYIQEAIGAENSRAEDAEDKLSQRIGTLETAIGESGSIASDINAAKQEAINAANASIEALDATESNTLPEGEDGVKVTVTQTDGKLTSVEVISNFDNTYDKKGSANSAETNAINEAKNLDTILTTEITTAYTNAIEEALTWGTI